MKKQKRDESDNSALWEALHELKKDGKESEEWTIELFEKAYVQEQKRLQHDKEKLRVKQLKEQEQLQHTKEKDHIKQE